MNRNNYHNVYTFDYHTPAEWRYDGEQEIMAAEKQQELAQRLTHEADRLVDQVKDSIVKNQLEIDHQAKVKVKDVEYMCYEIEKKISALNEEIGLLVKYQTRIENANKFLIGDSLDVISECLRLRNCRVNKDLVFDDVEKELLRERELILGIKDQLEDLLDKVILQIRKLRAFVYNLTVDLRYKRNTLKIEKHNEQLNENNIAKSVLNNKNVLKPAMISIVEWYRFTSDMISEADEVLTSGRPLHAFFDMTLSKMTTDLKAQSNAVDRAIKLRVDEYREAIEKLNTQKIETIKNIREVQMTIDKLGKAVDDKEACLALVHTRLSNRTHRDGVELCRDELEVKLYDEVIEFENNARSLQKMIADSVVCLRQLKQSLVRIDVQLDMKENSLHIDNGLCVEQRKRVDYSFY